jgi:L-asparaginase
MRVRVITTGGTIDKVYFDAKSEFEIGEPIIGIMLRESQVDFDFTITQLFRKDSLDMTDEDRRLVAATVRAAGEHKILVTHGTDTMTLTARQIIDDGAAKGKTVVLTGALNPARFRTSDALFNVGMAVATLQLAKPGVYIAMNGQVFRGDSVTKNQERNRFEAIEGSASWGNQ